jgi:hypothetical protein
MAHFAAALDSEKSNLGEIGCRSGKSADSVLLELGIYNLHGERDESPVHANC